MDSRNASGIIISWLAILLIAAISESLCNARVVRFEISTREKIAEGQSFGIVGGYEKLSGKIFFAVDPNNPVNRIITDIELAPRNKDDEVEFSADFFLIKPLSMEKANGTLLFEVSNRGGKGMVGFFDIGPSSLNPRAAAEFGDGFLFREGYTLLWVGWQFDVPQRPGLMRLYPPIATENGKPIRGLVRSDFVVSQREYSHILSDRDHIPYAVADPDAPGTQLTVRETVTGPRTVIARSQWKFARVEKDATVPDTGHIFLSEGFEPGKIYEVVYTSENPPLVGLGPAAVRDAISCLKFASPEASHAGISDDFLRRAIGFGISQSGRFLRTFLYYGFNKDEKHRKVFDGIMAHVAGAGRGSFNHRFAQPSRDAHSFMNFLYPTDIFPFTDISQTDRESDSRDGLFDFQKFEFLPNIFYSNSSYEYWGRAASLINTTVDGKKDVEILPMVRIYQFAGSQHGPAGFPPAKSIGQQLANPMDFRWSMRALLTAMNRWITEGHAPPNSRYPRLSDGTLVDPNQLNFPKIPGVNFSSRVHLAYRVNYGPRFHSDGIASIEPPQVGNAFPILVPKVDVDGNEIAGIRMPEAVVPLATYTGWNLFNAASGPTNEISSMVGSYIPFPRTKTERQNSGDPRASIEERYANRDEYLGKITRAAIELMDQNLLLAQDVPEIVRRAARHWDYRMNAMKN